MTSIISTIETTMMAFITELCETHHLQQCKDGIIERWKTYNTTIIHHIDEYLPINHSQKENSFDDDLSATVPKQCEYVHLRGINKGNRCHGLATNDSRTCKKHIGKHIVLHTDVVITPTAPRAPVYDVESLPTQNSRKGNPSGYMLFLQSRLATLKQDGEKYSFRTARTLSCAVWKNLSDNEKKYWEAQATSAHVVNRQCEYILARGINKGKQCGGRVGSNESQTCNKHLGRHIHLPKHMHLQEVNQEVNQEVSPEVSPEVNQEVSLEVSPEVNKVSPEVNKVSPEVNQEVSLEVSPEVNKEVSPEVNKEVSPEVNKVSPEVNKVSPEVNKVNQEVNKVNQEVSQQRHPQNNRQPIPQNRRQNATHTHPICMDKVVPIIPDFYNVLSQYSKAMQRAKRSHNKTV